MRRTRPGTVHSCHTRFTPGPQYIPILDLMPVCIRKKTKLCRHYSANVVNAAIYEVTSDLWKNHLLPTPQHQATPG